MLAELSAIHARYPHIGWEALLGWGTRNGAKALGFDDIGTIEVGKKPGILQITGLDQEPIVKRLY